MHLAPKADKAMSSSKKNAATSAAEIPLEIHEASACETNIALSPNMPC